MCILNAVFFSVKPKPAAKMVVAPLCCRNPKCDNPNNIKATDQCVKT